MCLNALFLLLQWDVSQRVILEFASRRELLYQISQYVSNSMSYLPSILSCERRWLGMFVAWPVLNSRNTKVLFYFDVWTGRSAGLNVVGAKCWPSRPFQRIHVPLHENEPNDLSNNIYG